MMHARPHGWPVRRMLVALLVPLAVLLAGVSCKGGDQEVLTIRYWQAPSVPSPYLSGGTKDRDAAAITLEPLAHYDPSGVLVPALAEELPTRANGGVAADQLSITWRLKPGLKWSDGSDLTAGDAVFTWEYCRDEATGCTAADVFTAIESVEALDDLTIQIRFVAPTPYPYQAFVGAESPIISRAQFENCVGARARLCEEEHLAPLGSGPYRIVDFGAGEEIVYERNPYYRGERPFFDRVILKGGGDADSAARDVLERGEADYAWNLQVEPDLLASLRAEGRGTIVTAFSSIVERIVLNQTDPDPALGDGRSEYLDGANPHPLLSFRPIRRAMSLALDRQRIAALYGDAARPVCDLVAGPPHYVSGANDSCLAQDIAGANAVLDEAGVLDSDGDGIREHEGRPLRFSYMTSTNAIRQATQAMVLGWWREIGIETELIDHPADVYFGGDPVADAERTYRRFYADVQMFAIGSGIEPQGHLSDYRCAQIPTPEQLWAGGNVSRSCDPAYDAAFDRLLGLPLGAEREAQVKRLNDHLVRSFIVLPLVSRGAVSAHLDSLHGVRFNAWDSEMWNIAEWRR